MIHPDNLLKIEKAYRLFLNPICNQYDLSKIELDILLFLANSQQHNTASDIVKRRFFTKSHVSASVKTLVDKELIKKEFWHHNRKTVHLVLTSSSHSIIKDGQKAQQQFLSALKKGMTIEQVSFFDDVTKKIIKNTADILQEDTHV